MEKPDDDEAATTTGLVETITRIQTKVYRDSQRRARAQLVHGIS
jgi:hypothetical protein